ncbi:iron-sulfur cluster assembly protein [Paraflavisolibacter sp. H34]|uniref:metal-sulfur cluster assembly factor n=1 Tax=Huijunlia imazamoxiresistens TaxID=3127457 RepID=UPI003019317A
MLTENAIIEKLKTIYDPEIPVNIYDLGLIYQVQVIGGQVYLLMTLTTATCPAAAFLPEEVRQTLEELQDVAAVHLDVVYEPAWTQDRMSAEAKKILGFG